MNLKNPLSWISLGLGSGLSPIAPGTVGSLFALLIYYFFIESLLVSWIYSASFLLFILFSFFVGLYIYPRTVEAENDPGSFVWDEFVGMWIACIPLPFLNTGIVWLFLAFLIFRVFDIWKPFGIKLLDKKHGAFYVMIDDVLAGFFAAIALIFLSLIFS
jgi:phosphatidylglycerophosphatase A|tara:strand:+ start:1540 stop:2016 length:477 start_codon:yes stop_codon:yes gene_type:complete